MIQHSSVAGASVIRAGVCGFHSIRSAFENVVKFCLLFQAQLLDCFVDLLQLHLVLFHFYHHLLVELPRFSGVLLGLFSVVLDF